jgi:hypothetical protein
MAEKKAEEKQADSSSPRVGLGGLGTAFGGGMQFGSSVAGFFAALDQAKAARNERRLATKNSFAILGNLLGAGVTPLNMTAPTEEERASAQNWIAMNSNLAIPPENGDPEYNTKMARYNEYMRQKQIAEAPVVASQTVQEGSYDSRFLPVGTALQVGGNTNGLDPRIRDTRAMLYELLNREGMYRPEEAKDLRSMSSAALGQDLASSGPTGESFQGDIASVTSLGGAGGVRAQTDLQIALENKQYRRQAKETALNFLQQLYQMAGNTF